jgi:hypothetical protein
VVIDVWVWGEKWVDFRDFFHPKSTGYRRLLVLVDVNS